MVGVLLLGPSGCAAVDTHRPRWDIANATMTKDQSDLWPADGDILGQSRSGLSSN